MIDLLFLSRLIQAQAHPQYCSDDFMRQCFSYYKRLNRKGHVDDESKIIQIVAGHLTSIMRSNGIGFDQLMSNPEFLQLSERL